MADYVCKSCGRKLLIADLKGTVTAICRRCWQSTTLDTSKATVKN